LVTELRGGGIFGLRWVRADVITEEGKGRGGGKRQKNRVR